MVTGEGGRRWPPIWEPGRPAVCGACGGLVLTPWMGRCDACGRDLPRSRPDTGDELGTTCACCGATDHRSLRAYRLGGVLVALCTGCAALAATINPLGLAELRDVVRRPADFETRASARAPSVPPAPRGRPSVPPPSPARASRDGAGVGRAQDASALGTSAAGDTRYLRH
jgi:hypothetical protein